MANPQPRRRAQNQPNPPGNKCNNKQNCSPKEDLERKRKALEQAEKDYVESYRRNNPSPPSTPTSELFDIARKTFKGSVKVASGLINAGAQVGNAFERDLRNHSLEGQIDNAMVNALFNKQKTTKSGGLTRTTTNQSGSKRKIVPVLIEITPGNWVMVDKSKVVFPKRARGR